MPLTIASNIAALNAQRRLAQTTGGLTQVFEHLSSGLRINRAVDDAAGLAVADSLRVDTRVALQGVRNLNDALSLTNIADGATNELSSIIVRVRELAEQSANGTLGNSQRIALDEEAQSLSAEYFRIVRTTNFNGLNLFDGSLQELRAQAGYGENGGVRAGLGGIMGNGSFAQPVSSTGTTGLVFDSALADFNGDGIVDIVSASTNATGFLEVQLGTGSGSFGPSISYVAEPSSTNSVEAGDLNGDGVIDLVTAGYPGSGRATVWIGAGDGTFSQKATIAAGLLPRDVAFADVNGDGNLDLAIADSTAIDGMISIRLGRGDGTFGAETTYLGESGSSRSLAFNDLNNDGILDLISGGGADGNVGYSTVRLGAGDGTFKSSISFANGLTTINRIGVADFNNDGNLDLVAAATNASTTGYVSVQFGTGTGTFGAAFTYFATTSGTLSVVVGDYNSDGRPDFATASTGELAIFLGAEGGGVQRSAAYTTSNTIFGLASDDLNGDGVLDLVGSGSNGTNTLSSVYLGQTQSGIGPLLPFSLRTLADARQAMGPLERAQQNLIKARGSIGAFQSRLGVAINTVTTSAENYKSAESQLRDVEISDESSRLVRLSILQQAGAAVLAQANIQPRLALTLLG